MKTLALIPARTGSKGIPGKNTRLFFGQPLWKWAYRIGEAVCDYAWLSTDAPWQFSGVNILHRPATLAQDDTPMLPVVQHALDRLKGDVVMLLQPTQPLRTVEHVRWALALLEESLADSVVSVVEIPGCMAPAAAVGIGDDELHPYHMGHRWENLPTRRQDVPKAYYRDGTVYVVRREVVEAGSLYGENCQAMVVPQSQSCTIDTEHDWKIAECLMRERFHA